MVRIDKVAITSRTGISMSRPHPEMTGRDLADIVREWGLSRDEAIARLQPAGAVYFDMDEADVRRILKYPRTIIGSDGIAGPESSASAPERHSPSSVNKLQCGLIP